MADQAIDPSTEDPDSIHAGRYWHAVDDGRIQCDICPRACKLAEGQRGLCFVRGRLENQIVLTTYGRSSGFCIDPIEKKPLNHFLPGTAVLSFGTAGCNLGCKFCQNWDMSKSREMDKLQDQAQPEALALAAKQSGCRSVAYTYNDPVIFLEYAVDVAKACREYGIKNVAVSAGYVCPEPRAEFFSHMDAANIDLKAFSQDFYKKICAGELGAVLDTLVYLKHETDVWFEITTLLIPDENDSATEIAAMSSWIIDNLGPDVPIHFTAFHPDYRMLNKDRTPPQTLMRAYKIAKSHGIRHVYTGNIQDEPTGSTYCAGCGTKIIGRDWHQLTEWNLSHNGVCKTCASPLAGVIEAKPGNWGRKRQRVLMKNFRPKQSAQKKKITASSNLTSKLKPNQIY